ncbi:hypothetical protein [Holophaga foetida]|uniref:hypothetical protein n=1 Tax=Holophaga foetida TaxID=35839 RepID=UPI0002472114|nr:hypothetical protein [Holophaga foetida]
MPNPFLKQIHQSWEKAIPQGLWSELETVVETLRQRGQLNHVLPEADLVLRFLSTDLNKVKVVILGQDPYPQRDAITRRPIATGRAFEVNNYDCWLLPTANASLRNFLKNLYRHSHPENRLPPIAEIRRAIQSQRFVIPGPSKLFDHWERQGVLLLNTSFTTLENNPDIHAPIWRQFTLGLLRAIQTHHQMAALPLRWIYLGGRAKEIGDAAFSALTADQPDQTCAPHPALHAFTKNDCFFNIGKERVIDWGAKHMVR